MMLNLDRVMRLDGKSANDMRAALRVFEQAMEEQALIVSEFRNLQPVPTLDDVPKLKNAVVTTGLIVQALFEIKYQFSNSRAKEVADEIYSKAVDLRSNIIASVSSMMKTINESIDLIDGRSNGIDG